MATFQAVVLKGKIHVRNDKKSNIKIRITHNRKADYISTDIYIDPKHIKHGIARNDVDADFINERIRSEISKYNTRFLKLGPLPDYLTVKELKERLMKPDAKCDDIDFFKFTEDYIKELEQEGKINSKSPVQSLLTNLRKFTTSLTFNQVDLSFLRLFEAHLKKEGVGNAVSNYMRYFRLIFNRGRDKYNNEDRGIIRIPHYPFKKYKIEKPVNRTQEHCLTADELRLFINYKPIREREQMAHDMFILMFCLIGINSKDLYLLTKQDRKGRVKYERSKTERPYSIKLEPEAKQLIEKYKGAERLINVSERYANYRDWQKYVNIELKKIAAEIQKQLDQRETEETFPAQLSTNWARHTWATIARNDCRISKDDVALCLGHEDADNKVTDIYISYDYSIIDESNRKVLDLVFKMC